MSSKNVTGGMKFNELALIDRSKSVLVNDAAEFSPKAVFIAAAAPAPNV
jgi:hypothetical protein